MVYNTVQYVRFDTVGSTARKVMPTPAAKTAVMPKARKHKRAVLYVDPVALLGIVVAVCMVLTMSVGIVQFLVARQEAVQMEAYVEQLTDRNHILSREYASGYDLEQIEKSAYALGMVPKSQVQSVSIQVSAPQQVEAVTLWDRIGTFLTSLFA